jgi:hypothetical protein
MSQPVQITLEGAVAEIVASTLVWIAIMVAFVIAALWAVELCERAYHFFWKVHDEER